MGDCAYCGKRRINFNQDEDYTMRIENNDRGDHFIATGELMIDSIPISFCPFCGCDLTKKVDVDQMTTHRLKVFVKYADAIMNGTKTFEVRKNDRGYKVGDKIVFDVVTNKGYAVGAAARHPLNGATYRIDYILDDFEGLAQKYVALAISKVDK
jgi:hypothetical protein